MGVYNCEKTVGEAIRCILDQTFTNWELIICDDGSSDATFGAVSAFQRDYPEKVRVMRNEANKGLNLTLNRCLKEARGEYIARMDGDDICSPDRFEKELKILLENEDIDIVSTDMNYFDEAGEWGLLQHPKEPVFQDFMKESPFCHAPCMVIRKIRRHFASKTMISGYGCMRQVSAAGISMKRCIPCGMIETPITDGSSSIG